MKPITLRIAEELRVREHQVAGAVSLRGLGCRVSNAAVTRDRRALGGRPEEQ